MSTLILILVFAVFAALAITPLIPQHWVDEANKRPSPGVTSTESEPSIETH